MYFYFDLKKNTFLENLLFIILSKHNYLKVN